MKKLTTFFAFIFLLLFISLRTSAACSTPSLYFVFSYTGNSIDASFHSVAGAIGYEYSVSTTPSTPTGSGIPLSITDTSFGITCLTPSTTYYVFVRANCGTGGFSTWSMWSMPITTQPSTWGCSGPSFVTGTPISYDSVSLTWDTAASPTCIGFPSVHGYEYLVDTNSCDPAYYAEPSTWVLYPVASSVAVGGLSPATLYYAHVRYWMGGSSYSRWTNSSFTTPAITPTEIDYKKTIEPFYIKSYPNPVGNSLAVEMNYNFGTDANLSIHTIEGKLIIKVPIVKAETIIDVSDFIAGTYVIRFSDFKNNGVYKRFIKL